MKTQLVNIEPDDDYGSLRDKLLWTKSPRVILVWPGRSQILSTKLDLVLLKRLGQQRGIALGLMTFDHEVRSLARTLSIPVFDDLENIPESAWKEWQTDDAGLEVDRELPDLDRPPTRSSVFGSPQVPLMRLLILLLPIAVLLFALILLVPSAHITLKPVTLREFETFQFSLIEITGSEYPVLPHEVRRLEVAADYRIPTSGNQSSPDQTARGEVLFTNLTDDPVNIPAGTTVRASTHPSVYFQTLRDARLTAGKGEQTEVDVIASEPGPEANLSERTIDTIEGLLGLRVVVSNPATMTGGSAQLRAAVSPNDVRRIQMILQAELEQRFIDQISEALSSDEALLLSTYEVVETLQEDYDAEPGELADSLGLSLVQIAKIAIINHNDIEQLAAGVLAADLPPGYIFAPGSPAVTSIRESTDDESGITVVEADLSIRSYYDVDTHEILNAALGATVDEVEAFIQATFNGDMTQIITISPGWWPRFPLFSHQIEIEITPKSLP